MEREKNMFSFMPENRIIETRSFPMWVKMDHGWQEIAIPHKVITGWNMPVAKEALNEKS